MNKLKIENDTLKRVMKSTVIKNVPLLTAGAKQVEFADLMEVFYSLLKRLERKDLDYYDVKDIEKGYELFNNIYDSNHKPETDITSIVKKILLLNKMIKEIKSENAIEFLKKERQDLSNRL